MGCGQGAASAGECRADTCLPPPQIEKLKAEQSKQPPTPLLGRKVFADPAELSAKAGSLLRQPLHEKDPLRGRPDTKPEPPERPEAKVAYVRQELKPERLQPEVDRVQEGPGAEAGGRERGGEPEVAKPEGKASRQEAHAERARERHERRLERQESGEQAERRRERRAERRLERQESSEQEGPRGDPKAGG